MKPLFIRYKKGEGPSWSPDIRYLPTFPMGLLAMFVGVLALIFATLAVSRFAGLSGAVGILAFIGTVLGGGAAFIAAMHALSVPDGHPDLENEDNA